MNTFGKWSIEEYGEEENCTKLENKLTLMDNN